jgi:glutaredoxin
VIFLADDDFKDKKKDIEEETDAEIDNVMDDTLPEEEREESKMEEPKDTEEHKGHKSEHVEHNKESHEHGKHAGHQEHRKAHEEHHHHEKDDGTIKIKKSTLKKVGIAILVLALIALVVFAAVKYWPKGGAATGDKAKVEFYVMSKCPYGTQVEDGIKPVLDKLGDNVDFSINFIANDNGDGTFDSLHGETEVQGNIVQLCAMKYEPKKYMDMIVCMNADAASIPTNWEACAATSKLDSAKIKACYEGAEGKQLLSESIKKSEAVQASGSPTMFIGGKDYNGGRDELSFQRAICAYLPAGNSGCAGIPVCAAATDCPSKEGMIAKCTNPNAKDAKCEYTKAQEVALTIVNDKTCTSCDSTRLETVLKQLFPGVKITQVDVSSAEGKKLVAEMGLVYAPSYVFDSNLEKTETWASNTNIRGAFEKIGESYKITDSASGATKFISADAQKAYEAQQEAALAEMRSKMGVVTTDNKPQIDFFVMAYCPYGNQAEEAIEPVYQLLKSKAIFNPRYVIYSNYGGGGPTYCLDAESKYCSMHGIQELNQNIREMCVNKYMGIDSTFKFMLAMNAQCSSSNADTCWEAVAKGLGLDTAKIKTCEAGEGLALVKAQKDLGDLAGVSGSPTVFIDGVEYSGARTAEGFKTGLCNAFTTKPSECSTTLESGAAATTGSC